MRLTAVFDYTPRLAGARISLRPLQAEDFDAIYAAAADPLLWAQHPFPLRYRRDVFETGYWNSAVNGPGALVITENATGAVIGSSRFYDWNPDTGGIVIGYTFLTRAHWGGETNRELKQLMLQYAFRSVKRVGFQVGVNNLRSRKALEKIGALYSHEDSTEIDGVVHRHACYCIEAPISPP